MKTSSRLRPRFGRAEPSLSGRGQDHCVVTAASVITAKCELNIGKIRPYQTYHAACMSRPRRRPCSRQPTMNGATEVERLNQSEHNCDQLIVEPRSMSKIPLDEYATRRPLQVQNASCNIASFCYMVQRLRPETRAMTSMRSLI